SQNFGINIYAFAIMSNHYHLVLEIDHLKTKSWSKMEVAQRWFALFKGNKLLQKFIQNEDLNPIEKTAISALIELYRKRLADISWFMRCINEYIARKANKEDECTGRFWEGRFKSQALC